MDLGIFLLTYIIGAIAALLSGRKYSQVVALIASVIALGIWIGYYPNIQNGQTQTQMLEYIPGFGSTFTLFIDGLSYSLCGLCAVLLPFIIASVNSKRYPQTDHIFPLILFMAFAMCGTFLVSNALLYYIFWELALIPIFFIGLIWGNDDWKARRNAMTKFFIYTFAGSLFMLIAFIYLYSKSHSFEWNDLVQIPLNTNESNWIFLAFFLAFGIKIPIFPLHTWQANTYEKSPAFGTMLLSGIMLKMGLYSIIRWQLPLTKTVDATIIKVVLILCIIGIIYASLIALKQNHIKRLLAYSSMAHVGLIAAGIYTQTFDGTQGAMLQMLAHGIVVVALFYIAEIIYERYGTYLISEMGGIRAQAVKFSSLFLIFLFASIALPGTFNFIGEFTLLLSLSHYNMWFAIFGGTTIILGAYYMLKMFQQVMLGHTNTKQFNDLSTKEFIILGLLAIMIIAFGIYTKPIYAMIAMTDNF